MDDERYNAPGGGASSFLRQCEEFIRTEQLVRRGNRVIVAVSGGVDSIVLLDILTSLSNKLRLEVIVGHVNHGLRGRESDGDQAFVEETAKRYGLRCIVARVATKEYSLASKMSLQDAARELRYAFLKELLSSSGGDWIATAHHADDNAETLLLHFVRGTGLQGLRGILPKREDEKIIRPLLFARRPEIAAYARCRRLKFREDSSNAKDKYSRNAIRHKVLPVLEQYVNPGIVRTLNTTARIFEQTGRLIERAHDEALEGCLNAYDRHTYGIKLRRLQQNTAEMQQALLYRFLTRLPEAPVTSTAVAQVLRLAKGQVGKHIRLNKRWNIVRDRDELVISDLQYNGPVDFSLNSFGIVNSSGVTLTVERADEKRIRFRRAKRDATHLWVTTEYVDADKLRFPLHLRLWEKGDWFIPLGMSGKKKVSNMLADAHVPARQKKLVCVLCSANDIVWVCGIRLDNRFRITAQTQHVARLKFHHNKLMTTPDE